MANLADYIEQHLMRLLDLAGGGSIEIQRRDLADRFRCVPSQINYVISTRFTTDRGFLVESRRGEGGYIRIFRVHLDSSGQPSGLVNRMVGDSLSDQEMGDVLFRLRDSGMISAKDELIKSAVRLQCDDLREKSASLVRARILKAVLLTLLSVRREYDRDE
jgi:transcriptional regulator CtsR